MVSRRSKTGELTSREREIVRLLVSGHTVAEIAICLGRHQSTIYGHIERIREQLGIQNDTQIGVYAVCTGLVECPPGRAVISPGDQTILMHGRSAPLGSAASAGGTRAEHRARATP
jgi:DNA-binding CsgD family transcriptional regulator